MEVQERSRTSVQASLNAAFIDIERGWQEELSTRAQIATQENQRLLLEIHTLKETLSRFDELTGENARLRESLAAHGVRNEKYDAPEQSFRADNGDVCDAVKVRSDTAKLCNKSSTVSYEQYDQLRVKFEKIVRQLEIQKRQSGYWKTSFEKYRERNGLYKEKLERCKRDVKAWQQFLDDRHAASTMHRDSLTNLVAALETPQTSRIQTSRSYTLAPDPSSRPFHTSFTPDKTLAKLGTRHSPAPDLQEASPSSPIRLHSPAKMSAVAPVVNPELLNPYVHSPCLPDNSLNVSSGGSEVSPRWQQQFIHEGAIPSKTPSLAEKAYEEAALRGTSDDLQDGPHVLNEQDSRTAQYQHLSHKLHPGTMQSPFPQLRNEHPSSQSTEDEVGPVREQTATSTVFCEAEGKDEPVFISSRTLKRKREPERHYAEQRVKVDASKTGNGSNSTPYMVKHEESRSSPPGPSGMAQLHQEHSLDLDEIPGDVETPRKSRLRRMLSKNYPLDYVQGPDRTRSSSMPLGMEVVEHRLSDSFEELINEHSSRSYENPEFSTRIKTEEPEEESIANPPNRSSFSRMPEDQAQHLPRGKNWHVLQPLSVNKRALPWTSNPRLQRTPRRPFPVGEITEDGEKFSSSRPRTLAPGKTMQEAVPTPRVLNLLETPAPNKQLLTPVSLTNATRSRPSYKIPHPNLRPPIAVAKSLSPKRNPASPSKPAIPARNPPIATATTISKPRVRTPVPPTPRPEEEPLRARPLHRLTLDDFKINPASNQGYDYAFVEVVRGREQRHCLPGCTRPECCGDRFRKMVELGGALPGPGPGLWDSSPPGGNDNGSGEAGDDRANQRLLEAYLGADARGQLARMGVRERAEVMVRARAEELARRCGKHRQAFQRSTTPPGFWRTDMPSTQEVERDREGAAKLVRARVEERWREAMREGGRWLFRDE